MNPFRFVTGRITRLIHGLDDFLERDRAREMLDGHRPQGRLTRASSGNRIATT